MPKGIQLHRTKGWKIPANSQKIARPTRFGNPFQDSDQAVAAAKFEEYFNAPGKCQDARIEGRLKWMRENIGLLKGKDLACWCKNFTPCHRDTLLKAAKGEVPIEATPAAAMIAEVVKETVPAAPPAPVVPEKPVESENLPFG